MADRPTLIEAETILEKPYDTADPVQVNDARKKAGRKKRAEMDVVGGLMDLREGRAWLYAKLNACHIFRTPFFQGDPHATSFRCGEQNIGLMLLADIQAAAPKQYMTMIEEAHGRV